MKSNSKPAAAGKTVRRTIDPRGSDPLPTPTTNVGAAAIAAGVAPVGDIARRATSADKAKAKGAELVSVTVPNPFTYTAEGHVEHKYPYGIYDMPRAHAEDSFSVAHGVTINE